MGRVYGQKLKNKATISKLRQWSEIWFWLFHLYTLEIFVMLLGIQLCCIYRWLPSLILQILCYVYLESTFWTNTKISIDLHASRLWVKCDCITFYLFWRFTTLLLILCLFVTILTINQCNNFLKTKLRRLQPFVFTNFFPAINNDKKKTWACTKFHVLMYNRVKYIFNYVICTKFWWKKKVNM